MSNSNDVFHAISDPNRRRLLSLMMSGEQSVTELKSQFDMTIGAVSQHLKVLREAGLVHRRSAGRQRLYRAEPAALKEVHDWAGQFSRFWESRLDLLGEVLDNEP
ncbi:ArsR/SmtB family transcription factor [Roseobacteraceae bacterium NS-SX3]